MKQLQPIMDQAVRIGYFQLAGMIMLVNKGRSGGSLSISVANADKANGEND